MKILITLDCPTLLPYQRDDLLAAVGVLARGMGGEIVGPIDGLEYAVDDYSGAQRTFHSRDEAAAFAMAVALTGKSHVHIDVLCWSREAAIGYQGEDFAAHVYDADPDASTHDRIRVTAESVGSVA